VSRGMVAQQMAQDRPSSMWSARYQSMVDTKVQLFRFQAFGLMAPSHWRCA
jgi:hypothetical protein